MEHRHNLAVLNPHCHVSVHVLPLHSPKCNKSANHLIANPMPAPRMPRMMPQEMMTMSGWFHLTGLGASSPSTSSLQPFLHICASAVPFQHDYCYSAFVRPGWLARAL